MSIAGGIAVIAIGAILTFALSWGTVGGLDLNIVGVIPPPDPRELIAWTLATT